MGIVNEQRHWKWLEGKLPGWVSGGLLSDDQARTLLAERPPATGAAVVLTRILIGFSALLLGLGVISFFAFNWQAMPRWLKLLTIFTAFAGTHTAGIVTARRSGGGILPEFFHLLGTAFFGAAIALVAQVYHIDEHPPNGMLMWAAGALLMAWTLDSSPQMLVCAVLAVAWQLMEREYGTPRVWVLLPAAACWLPLAFRKRNAFIATVTTLALLALALVQITYLRSTPLASLLCLGGLGMGAGLLIRRAGYPACARAPAISGALIYYIVLVVLTFSEAVGSGLIRAREGIGPAEWLFPAALALASAGVWAAWLGGPDALRTGWRDPGRRHLLAVPVALAAGTALWVWGRLADPGTTLRSEVTLLAMVFFNLFTAVQGLMMIFAGTRGGRVGTAFLGSLLLLAVILGRFLSTIDDLLLRAAAFVIAGGLLLAVALKTARVRKELERDG